MEVEAIVEAAYSLYTERIGKPPGFCGAAALYARGNEREYRAYARLGFEETRPVSIIYIMRRSYVSAI